MIDKKSDISKLIKISGFRSKNVFLKKKNDIVFIMVSFIVRACEVILYLAVDLEIDLMRKRGSASIGTSK